MHGESQSVRLHPSMQISGPGTQATIVQSGQTGIAGRHRNQEIPQRYSAEHAQSYPFECSKLRQGALASPGYLGQGSTRPAPMCYNSGGRKPHSQLSCQIFEHFAIRLDFSREIGCGATDLGIARVILEVIQQFEHMACGGKVIAYVTEQLFV